MEKKTGFIGAGNMGGALINAACRSVGPEEVIITDYFAQKARDLAAQLGCSAADSNTQIAQQAQYIVLAVKPHLITDVVSEIAPAVREAVSQGKSRIIVTIAAGVAVSKVREALNIPEVPVIRIMPNMPAMVGDGMILIPVPDKRGRSL